MSRVALVCRGCGTAWPIELPEHVQLGDESVAMAFEHCDLCGGSGRMTERPLDAKRFVAVGPVLTDDDVPF